MPRKDSHAMGEPLVTLSGRLPLSVLARVDAYVESMRRATPGLNIGRSDALRILLVQALDATNAPTAGAVTDTVTDTSPLRLQLQEELRALRAGTAAEESVSDKSLVLSMLQQEIRTLSASAEALATHTEGLIAATHTAEQGIGTVQGTVTDTVTDTQAQVEALPEPPAPQATPRARKAKQPVPDTVTDTDALQKTPRRRKTAAAH